MALEQSLAELREAVQRTADVIGFTDRHPPPYINGLINRAFGALHRKMLIVAPERRPISSQTVTTDGIATAYSLNTNFRNLLSVEYTGESRKTWLVPYELHERAALTEEDAVSGQASPRAYSYRIVPGESVQQIELLPRPPAGHTALLWYATTAPQFALSSASVDATTLNVYDRLDDFVIWWAAREIARERADWERYRSLGDDLVSLENEIQTLARMNDVSAPPRPVDVRLADRYGRPTR